VKNSNFDVGERMSLYFILSSVRKNWIMVASLVAASVGMALVYGIISPIKYKAEVSLIRVDGSSAIGPLGQLGGLASLAGVQIGTGEDSTRILAVLSSQDFAMEVIRETGIADDIRKMMVPVIGFRSEESFRGDTEVSEYFKENVFRVLEDKKTGVIRLAVLWPTAEGAATIVNKIPALLNLSLRSRAKVESDLRLKYLISKLESEQVGAITSALSSLVEAEMTKALALQSGPEFAVSVVDKAEPPVKRTSPRRALACVLGAIFGFGVGVFVSLLRLNFGRKSGSDSLVA
jgi:uncharacterized protein involved in exopolysaccharide biosynthesis